MKEWHIGGHGVYTQAAEVEVKPRVIVAFLDRKTGEFLYHEFPADFIRPVLETPDLLNALMYPDFVFVGEREWVKIVNIINMFYHREHPYKMIPKINEKERKVTWKELEH